MLSSAPSQQIFTLLSSFLLLTVIFFSTLWGKGEIDGLSFIGLFTVAGAGAGIFLRLEHYQEEEEEEEEEELEQLIRLDERRKLQEEQEQNEHEPPT